VNTVNSVVLLIMSTVTTIQAAKDYQSKSSVSSLPESAVINYFLVFLCMLGEGISSDVSVLTYTLNSATQKISISIRLKPQLMKLE